METIEVFNSTHLSDVYGCSFANSLEELDTQNFSVIDNIDGINNGTNLYLITDMSHPFCTSSTDIIKGIHINEDYFAANKDLVEQQLVNFIEKYQGKEIVIKAPVFITDRVIEAIAANDNIKEITFGSLYNKDYNFTLTEEIYKKFKASKKEKIFTQTVTEELEMTFDPIIDHNVTKPLFGNINYKYLITDGKILITEPVDKENYRYIDCIPDGKKILINYEDFDNMVDFLVAISKRDVKPNITIGLENSKLKPELTSALLKYQDELLSLNLNVEVKLESSIPFMKYLEYEKRLFDMIAPAINLSPFERYLYAYRVVSHYKIYKENKAARQESRKLYSILDNEFMVCVGYSTLLGDLLEKLGIQSSDYSVTTETTFDGVSKDILVTPEDIEFKTAYHARRIVHIDDPKYGISGIYIADPTWDNILQIDSFCYSALTPNESVQGARYFQFNNLDGTELLHINSVDEFYEKFNYMLRHRSNTGVKMSEHAPKIHIIETLIGLLAKLDYEFAKNFVSKYPDLNVTGLTQNYWSTKEYTVEEIHQMIHDICGYLLTKVNKPIPGETYEKALYEVYLNGDHLSVEDASIKTEKALHNTYVVTRDRFPKRMKITYDDEVESYDNETNKFEKYNLNAKSINL